MYLSAVMGGKKVAQDYEYSSGKNTDWIQKEYVHREMALIEEQQKVNTSKGPISKV